MKVLVVTAKRMTDWITTGRPSIVPREFLPELFLTRQRS